MSGETGGRRESRAARTMREAPHSVCPHCGRDSKTVSGGICADCWGVKDAKNAYNVRPEPKTEPLLGWDFGALGLDLVHVAWLVAAILAVVVAVLLGVR